METKINWDSYRIEVRELTPEEGGGFLAIRPTFGLGVYGCGDTFEEALEEMFYCQEVFQIAVNSSSNFVVPPPTKLDYQLGRSKHGSDNSNFGYAA